MTGNLYLDLLVSLAGVAVLVAVSFALGGWKSVRVDEASARDRIAFDEPDFQAAEWFFDADGKAAAALSADGSECVFVFAVGDGLATRRTEAGAVELRQEGEMAVAALHDPSRWVLKLRAASQEEAARWASRLGGADYNRAHGHDVS